VTPTISASLSDSERPSGFLLEPIGENGNPPSRNSIGEGFDLGKTSRSETLVIFALQLTGELSPLGVRGCCRK
jgi:hypothetical protein